MTWLVMGRSCRIFSYTVINNNKKTVSELIQCWNHRLEKYRQTNAWTCRIPQVIQINIVILTGIFLSNGSESVCWSMLDAPFKNLLRKEYIIYKSYIQTRIISLALFKDKNTEDKYRQKTFSFFIHDSANKNSTL